MIACVDVGYQGSSARAACVVINNWRDAKAAFESSVTLHDVENYQPGEFYRRELPCIQRILGELKQKPKWVVIDGYVWLDRNNRPGLGAHLHRALKFKVPVIGVAKNPFQNTDHATELRRGGSIRPLFITAIGTPIAQAIINIGAMHGNHRLPSMLKRVDQLSRMGTSVD